MSTFSNPRRPRNLVPNDFVDHAEREANEENEVVAWAMNNGWKVRKMRYIGRNGCADRFFFGWGQVVQIEMKKRGGKLSTGQKENIREMAEVGITVHVCFSGKSAIEILSTIMHFHSKCENHEAINANSTDLHLHLGLEIPL